MEFDFPLRQEKFEFINSRDHLRDLLQEEALSLRVNKQFFRLLYQKGKYMYAKCRQCCSYLRYTKEQDTFRLVGMNSHHSHKLNQPSEQIQKFILSLPSTMSTQALLQITTQQFNITRSKFYYHNQKLWSEKIELKEIISQLDYMKHETRFLPFPLQDGQLPDVFITASPEMKENFKKYGENQFMTFDVTYNLVKQIKRERAENGQFKNKKWGLGLFLGKNCNNRAICFGFCLINIQTKDSFLGIFKSFFEMMGGEPATIITDEQIAIDAAIKQLKDGGDYQGYHLWDTFHILRNISKKTSNDELKRNLRDTMFAQNERSYKEKLQKSRQCCVSKEDISVYERFVKNSHRYCLSQIPTSFAGISISTSFGEKVNDFIKTYIPAEKPFKVVLRKVTLLLAQLLKIMKDLDQKSEKENLCSTPYQDIFGEKQLRMLRFVTCQPVFMTIIKNYVDSLPMKSEEDGKIWVVDDYQLQIRNQKLYCVCGYLQKCGIPCSHLIKLIFEIHEDILNYIHPRWKFQEKKKENKYLIKRGRPRFSRRHRQ